jgi:pimeloyl-ACP methyl ester carboxylesterase
MYRRVEGGCCRWSKGAATLLMLAVLCILSPRVMAASPFSVQVTGSGRPVIAVAGLSTSADVWRPMAIRMGKDFQFHLITLAGFAGTPAEAKGSLIPAAARAIVEYTSAQSLERPILLGHGVGGVILLKVAQEAPGLSACMVLVDTVPFLGAVVFNAKNAAAAEPDAARFRDMVAKPSRADFLSGQRLQVQGMATSEADRARLLGWMEHSDQASVAATLYESLTTDLRPQLSAIKARTLVLMPWIAPSPFTAEQTQKFVEFQYRGLSAAKVQVVRDTHSFIMLDQPVVLDGAFRQFVGQ